MTAILDDCDSPPKPDGLAPPPGVARALWMRMVSPRARSLPTMEAPIDVAVEVLAHARDIPLPAYATDGAAGMDLFAAVTEPVVLAPGARGLVPTGLKIAIPAGFEAQVRPRSGWALRLGLVVPNSPGTIDADYRGEVSVILMNLGSEPVTIDRGVRVAQLVFAPVARARLVAVASLPSTARGAGGFGHTGIGPVGPVHPVHPVHPVESVAAREPAAG